MWTSVSPCPQVRKKPPSVPPTVCDQVRLWAKDRTRVREAGAYTRPRFGSTKSVSVG